MQCSPQVQSVIETVAREGSIAGLKMLGSLPVTDRKIRGLLTTNLLRLVAKQSMLPCVERAYALASYGYFLEETKWAGGRFVEKLKTLRELNALAREAERRDDELLRTAVWAATLSLEDPRRAIGEVPERLIEAFVGHMARRNAVASYDDAYTRVHADLVAKYEQALLDFLVHEGLVSRDDLEASLADFRRRGKEEVDQTLPEARKGMRTRPR